MSLLALTSRRTDYGVPDSRQGRFRGTPELKKLRRQWENSGAFHGGSHEITAIDDAEWQAGVTTNNAFYRVTLNGEPVPNAIAASARRGWVLLQIFGEIGGDRVTGTQRRDGVVRIVPGDRV